MKEISMIWDVIRSIYLKWQCVQALRHDQRLGIVTTDEVIANYPGLLLIRDKSEYNQIYRATSYRGAARILDRLDPTSADAFLDIGCGAGRMICVAAQYSFSRIIGLEMDPVICNRARSNINELRTFVVRPEIVCGDATKFKISDDITIVFLYNTFGGDPLRALLAHILESYDRQPRRIRIVYLNPREHAVVETMGRFSQTGMFAISWRPGRDWLRTQTVRIYEGRPPNSSEYMN